MARYERYERLVNAAEDETKRGGDPQKGLVFAILALAEATIVTEPPDRIEISGSLAVDS